MMTTAARMPIHTPAGMPPDEPPPPADVPLTGRMLMNDSGPYAASTSPFGSGCGLKPVQSGLYASSDASFHSTRYGWSR